MKPTDEERRNGWTEDALTEYLASREAGQSQHIDPDSKQRREARRKDMQNHRYNPHRWRR